MEGFAFPAIIRGIEFRLAPIELLAFTFALDHEGEGGISFFGIGIIRGAILVLEAFRGGIVRAGSQKGEEGKASTPQRGPYPPGLKGSWEPPHGLGTIPNRR